jgi:RNA ligase
MKYQHFDSLDGLIAEKLVSKRKHPFYDLWIYNYTDSAQHKPISEWTDALRDCRGLILDESGNLVARGFRKFWNLEQTPEIVENPEWMKVFDKMDGSMGIVFRHPSRFGLIVSTRGSFQSDQAVEAQKMIDSHPYAYTLRTGLSYIFEIIYPENRIVVDYGSRRELVLLAVLNNDGDDDWVELDRVKRWFPKAQVFPDVNVDRGKGTEAEGFVVVTDKGRVKVKTEDYKKLHRLFFSTNTRTIWQAVWDDRVNGTNMLDSISHMPVDFQDWVTLGYLVIFSEIKSMLSSVEDHATVYGGVNIGMDREGKKKFAEYVNNLKCEKPIKSALFKLAQVGDLTSNSIYEILWKSLDPTGNVKFFRSENE